MVRRGRTVVRTRDVYMKRRVGALSPLAYDAVLTFLSPHLNPLAREASVCCFSLSARNMQCPVNPHADDERGGHVGPRFGGGPRQ